MAVGVFKKSQLKMTPPAFGRDAPCSMADGTPTYESGMCDHRTNTSGWKHKKRRIPRQLFCADAVHIFLYCLRMGFSTAPNPHPCELNIDYTQSINRLQIFFTVINIHVTYLIKNPARWRDFFRIIC